MATSTKPRSAASPVVAPTPAASTKAGGGAQLDALALEVEHAQTEVARLHTAQNAATAQLKADTAELDELSETYAKLDHQRGILEQARNEARAAAATAQQAVTRNRGRATESVYLDKFVEAQALEKAADDALAALEQQELASKHARITELRETIQRTTANVKQYAVEERQAETHAREIKAAYGMALADQVKRRLAQVDTHMQAEQATLSELRDEKAALIADIPGKLADFPTLKHGLLQECGRADGALENWLTGYMDFLEIIDAYGVAAMLEIDDAEQSRFLGDFSLSYYQLGAMFQMSFDGERFYRNALTDERRELVRLWLDKARRKAA